jgi:hypothetical protein
MQSLLAINLRETFWGDAPASTGLIDSPQTLISSILPNIYIIAALMLLAYLVFGGFLIVTSAGSTEQSGKGKSAITNAVIGLGIIIGSYWLMQVIQVITGIDIL